jgi:hypothetical protein
MKIFFTCWSNPIPAGQHILPLFLIELKLKKELYLYKYLWSINCLYESKLFVVRIDHNNRQDVACKWSDLGDILKSSHVYGTMKRWWWQERYSCIYIARTINTIISNQFYLRVKLFNVVCIERITIKHARERILDCDGNTFKKKRLHVT